MSLVAGCGCVALIAGCGCVSLVAVCGCDFGIIVKLSQKCQSVVVSLVAECGCNISSNFYKSPFQ